ncbi:MAG: type II toxin-antitoxin system VapC family toxin [Kiritimatiellia bacterium]
MVFDSYALLAFIFDEPGAETVADIFKQALTDKRRISICTVNWAEVIVSTIRVKGKTAWKTVHSHLQDLPFEIVDADQTLSEAAAEFKAAHKITLANAYAAALTKTKRAELVTGDPEFEPLEKILKQLVWLGR